MSAVQPRFVSSSLDHGANLLKPRIYALCQIISMLHRRFPKTFTPGLVSALSAALAPPNRAALAALAPEQREKEDASRITRQRPVLRVCAELALVGIIRDAPGRSGGEWMIKVIKDLVSSTLLQFAYKLIAALVI